MKSFFQNIESVIQDIGVLAHDCHVDIPKGREYHQLAMGRGAITLEESLCLAGLVFIERPDVIIELGTETGASSLVLGAAAKDLGKGFIYSVDLAPRQPSDAARIRDKYMLPIEYVVGIDSIKYLTDMPFDQDKTYFVFSDTDIKIRPKEVELVRKRLPKGTLVAVHDTSENHPFGPMKLYEKLETKTPVIELQSPRGLSILRT
jgi:predicted O-methyltransferase YrrM